MTQSRIATHQLLRLLGGLMTKGSQDRYHDISQQILGALTVINWLNIADDSEHEEIYNAARALAVETHIPAPSIKYLIGTEVGARVAQ